MNTYKITLASLLLSAVVVVTLAPSVQAQTNIIDLLNRRSNGAPQQQEAPHPSTIAQLSSGLQPSAAPQKSVESVLWANKAEFLAATRNGDLVAIDRAAYFGSKELRPIANSIASILHTDYGVPLPISDPKVDQTGSCRDGFEITVGRALSAVTKLHAETLTEQSPDYYKEPDKSSITSVGYVVRDLSSGTTNYCDREILGVRKPHPYAAALLGLMDEYGQATKDYVEAERSRRKTAYAEEQARIHAGQKARADAQAKQNANARAAEQQRIDEERVRIQREQKKREEQEKNRVGG